MLPLRLGSGGTRASGEDSAVNCHGVMTIPRGFLDPEPIGRLDLVRMHELDRALRFALEIRG